MTTPSEHSPTPPAGRPRRLWLPVTALALAAALVGAATTSAVGQYGPPWAGGWHGPGFMHGPLSPAEVEQRIDRGIRHAAIELDATAEQQERLRAIAKGAIKDLLPIREKVKAARAKAADLLTQPSIDRAAIEALRAEQVGLVDAASKRLAQAIADAADVLTLEQRQKASALLQWRRALWHRWHGWYPSSSE